MRDYGKLMWAILGAIAFALQAGFTDNEFTRGEVVGTIIAGVNALAVWLAQDTTLYSWIKNATAGLLAALLVAQTAIDGGFTMQEWWAVIIAGLTAAGVIVDQRRPVYTAVLSRSANTGSDQPQYP